MKSLAVVLLGCCAVQAEILEMNLRLHGVENMTLAHLLTKHVERIRGVESARIALNTGVLSIRLREDNRVKLEDIVRQIRRHGVEAITAELRVQGPLAENVEIRPLSNEGPSGQTSEEMYTVQASGLRRREKTSFKVLAIQSPEKK